MPVRAGLNLGSWATGCGGLFIAWGRSVGVIRLGKGQLGRSSKDKFKPAMGSCCLGLGRGSGFEGQGQLLFWEGQSGFREGQLLC